jgi:kynurenine formamidase
MRFVDLSAAIGQSPAETPEGLRTDIEYVDRAAGAEQIEQLLGVPARLLCDGEGWAVETFTSFGTQTRPTSTRPGTTIRASGAARAGDRRAAARLVLRPRCGLDMTAKEDGDSVDVADVEAELDRIGHELGEGDIVLVRTGRDARYGEPGYMALGPGVTAGATVWFYERGVRVMRIDDWGWDAPLHLQAQEALERDEPAVFWAAHQCDIPYCQIERLVNLDRLPSSGFQVACFPLRIVGASAAPARVVAILPE